MSAALELYEPLFQYLCKVNRLARKEAEPDYGEVRRRVIELLSAAESNAEDDPVLREHVRKLHTPVKYFVDDILGGPPSKLSWKDLWHKKRLGFVKDGLAGDEAFFFDYLDPALEEPPSPGHAERLLVYYVCLGLGFSGFYWNNPDKLRSYMKALQAHIRPFLVEDHVPKLVPQAYRYTDTRDFVRPPRLKTALLLAGLACLLAAGLPLYFWLAEKIIDQEPADLRQIRESHQGESVRDYESKK